MSTLLTLRVLVASIALALGLGFTAASPDLGAAAGERWDALGERALALIDQAGRLAHPTELLAPYWDRIPTPWGPR